MKTARRRYRQDRQAAQDAPRAPQAPAPWPPKKRPGLQPHWSEASDLLFALYPHPVEPGKSGRTCAAVAGVSAFLTTTSMPHGQIGVKSLQAGHQQVPRQVGRQEICAKQWGCWTHKLAEIEMPAVKWAGARPEGPITAPPAGTLCETSGWTLVSLRVSEPGRGADCSQG